MLRHSFFFKKKTKTVHMSWFLALCLHSAARCSLMRTVTWPTSFMKRQLWQKMERKKPSWEGFRKTYHLRWGHFTTCNLILDTVGKESEWQYVCFLSVHAGNYKAGSPLHPCRFPSCALWSLMSDWDCPLCRLRPVISYTAGTLNHILK